MTCEKCDECRNKGDKYCSFCGSPLVTSDGNKDLKSAVFILGILVTAVLTVLLIFEYVVAIWAAENVFSHLANDSYTLFIVIPWFVDLFTISGVALQAYYVFLLLAAAASIATILYRASDPMISLMHGDREPIKNTALFEMTILFAVLFIIQIVFVLLLQMFNVNIGSLPERETWKWMFDLLNASVWEELITRVLMLGLPMLVIAALLKKKEIPLWKYLFGGFEMDKAAFMFILFSAFIFGAAHLNNWESWKFFTTFAFGIIAGYLFVKYGLYATISMHFLTDYIQAEQWLTGSVVTVSTVAVLLISLLSIPYLYVYAKKGFAYLRSWSEKDSE